MYIIKYVGGSQAVRLGATIVLFSSQRQAQAKTKQ
jgi:hypothetical protein